jgi:hypothetical protein
MKPSAELETNVRARVARLELLDKHIIGFRVTVELETHTHKTGYIPQVHIEIEVPGKSITVTLQGAPNLAGTTIFRDHLLSHHITFMTAARRNPSS